jgi:hypothetical protein
MKMVFGNRWRHSNITELYSCFMHLSGSLKLAYDLAEEMHLSHRFEDQNKSSRKTFYYQLIHILVYPFEMLNPQV